MNRIRVSLAALAFLVGGLVLAGPASAAESGAQLAQAAMGEEEAPAKGRKACEKCHDETEKHPVLAILHTPHARMADPRTPFAEKECQTCHGESKEHMKKLPEGVERPKVDISFGPEYPSPPGVQNKVCIACHETGLRMHWRGSKHEVNNVTCTSCHDVHRQHDPMLVKLTQPQVCFTCHQAQRAQVYRPSRHPIREGKVACSDCHNLHGSRGPKLLVKGTVNETCYQCHTEKRGPFLWEHPPVREDCSNCHVPHGSVQPRLLKARTPWLCQECHLATYHPSGFYTGSGVPPRGAAQQILGAGCLNCHPKVHGSNHPSGPRFTR